MKFNFTNISKDQINLDNYIQNNNNLKPSETFERRKIAFLVELGEFINEVRSFKFWSKKESSPKEVILEEFIDGIHFIITLGNDNGNECWEYDIDIKEEDINIQIMKSYESFIEFAKTNDKKKFNIAFTEFLKIGVMLNFNQEDIEKAYVLKSKENRKRQDNNY